MSEDSFMLCLSLSSLHRTPRTRTVQRTRRQQKLTTKLLLWAWPKLRNRGVRTHSQTENHVIIRIFGQIFCKELFLEEGLDWFWTTLKQIIQFSSHSLQILSYVLTSLGFNPLNPFLVLADLVLTTTRVQTLCSISLCFVFFFSVFLFDFWTVFPMNVHVTFQVVC